MNRPRLTRSRAGHVMAGLSLVTLLAVPFGCGSDEDYDRACAVDADCQVVSSCCDGCFAIRVTEALDACDATCIEAPCETRFDTSSESLEAYCSAGLCEVRVATP